MDDDFVITPDLGRRATVKTIVVPPPAPAPAPAPPAPAPAPAPVIHRPVYERPIPYTGPPPAVYVSPTAASQGPQPMIQMLGDPTISSTINYSPHLETNYSQNASYYLKQGQGGGDPADWYQYPTQSGEILFDVSGFPQQVLSAAPSFYYPLALTDLEWEGRSIMPYTWYNYISETGVVGFKDASGNHDLQSIQGNLYYDGELLARAGDIQDIAAWSDYPMIHPIIGQGYDITGVGDITADSLKTTGDISGATLHTGVASVASLISAGDISGASLHISGAAAVGSLNAGGDISAVGDISGATLHISGTGTIHDIDLSGCALTSNAGGTALFVNGVQVQTGSPADVSQWATFPAVANVDVNTHNISMTGSLVPPATNKFGIGTALAPIAINDQYALSTNIYNIAPTGTMNISSNSSMAILTTSTTGTNEVNISLVGAAGEDMNLTAPDINLTMTDTTSFMNLTAPFGVTVAGGGGFFMAAGAMEVVTGLDIRLITTGNIAIGSSNVGGATTQIEKFEYTDNVVEPMNGVYDLKLKNIEVINVPRDAGGAGYFPGVFNVQAAISSTFTLQSVNTSSEKMLWQVQTDQGSSVYKSMNLISQGTGGVNFSMSAAAGTKMNMNYDGNTLAISRPTSITGNMGSSSITTGQITATGNISTPLNISGGSGYFGSIVATGDISGGSGHFGPLYSDSTEIHLGTATSTIGTNCVFIGNKAGQNLAAPQNGSIAIGEEAGEQLTGDDTICLGFQAGSRCTGGDNICIGYNAGSTSLAQAISIGAYSGIGGGQNNINIGAFANATPLARYNNTIILNATGSNLNATSINSFYVNPIADLAGGTGFNMLGHNISTGEIRRGTATLTEAQNTINNTQQISYDTGLLTTTINGITSLQTVKADGPVTIGTPTALSTLTVAGTIAIQDASGNTATQVVAQPQYVYYVSKNGRVGASGAITDPLSSINAALAKAANVSPVDAPGMTIYLGVGSYAEDVVINIAPATLPSVSIIGMGDDTDDSKRVQIRGAMTINATDASLVNTVNTVVLNNLSVFAKDVSSSAITMTGRGYRVYLKNGLYTTPFSPAVPLISLASTGPTSNSVVQLVVDNCSLSMQGSGNIINMTSGQLFEIQNSDLTHRGTGLTVNMAGGAFSSASQTGFNSAGAVMSLTATVASLTSLTNCLVSGRASPTVALITCGTNANLNITDCTIQNANTTEANSTSRYVYLTAGVLVASIRNNFSSSASPAITLMQPYQSTTPASSILFYFSNIYTNASNTVRVTLPTWAAVQQFSNDITPPTSVLRATSGTAITLTPTTRGNTYILTGTTTQAFTAVGLVASDVGYFVVVHNGNGVGGGDINLTGMTGTAIIHNRTATQNGGVLYLYWTGAALVGY